MRSLRWLALAAVVVVALGLSGCADDDGDDDTTAAGAATTAAPAASAAIPSTAAPEPTDTAMTDTAVATEGTPGTDTAPATDATSGADGQAVFTANCAACHTLAAAGATGQVGPNLDEIDDDVGDITEQVTNGGGGMPPFGGQLTPEEIDAVAAYVADNRS